MELLYILLVLLFVARVFGELAERLKQPALVGELISGVALGAAMSHYPEVFPLLSRLPHDDVFTGIIELAVFFLMLYAGVEMRPQDLVMASREAFLIALGGVLLPFGIGFALGQIYIPASQAKLAQSLFVATSLSVTAVPVAAQVLMEFGVLRSRLGRAVIAAAIFDDVLSLLLLAVLTAVIKTGHPPDLMAVTLLSAKVVAFFAIAILLAWYVRPKIEMLLAALRSNELEFSSLVIVAMAYALMAEYFGLHFILGAFIAGVLFADPSVVSESTYAAVREKLSGITLGFLAPLFFVSIGMNLEMSAAWKIPGFVAALVATAFAGKLAGAGLPAWLAGFSRREAVSVGVAMSARGAVELIIADVALREGLFRQPVPLPSVIQNMFSAVVIMAVVTTLAVPVVLRLLLPVPAASDKAQNRKSDRT